LFRLSALDSQVSQALLYTAGNMQPFRRSSGDEVIRCHVGAGTVWGVDVSIVAGMCTRTCICVISQGKACACLFGRVSGSVFVFSRFSPIPAVLQYCLATVTPVTVWSLAPGFHTAPRCSWLCTSLKHVYIARVSRGSSRISKWHHHHAQRKVLHTWNGIWQLDTVWSVKTRSLILVRFIYRLGACAYICLYLLTGTCCVYALELSLNMK